MDSENHLYELSDDELETLQETKQLHLRYGGCIDDKNANVFLLYKTSVEKVAE